MCTVLSFAGFFYIMKLSFKKVVS